MFRHTHIILEANEFAFCLANRIPIKLSTESMDLFMQLFLYGLCAAYKAELQFNLSGSSPFQLHPSLLYPGAQ